MAVANPSMSENSNPFDILGIEPTFDIDATALDTAYFACQALAHPDRFIHHSEPERQAAAAQASSLNNAYEVLKNPTLRAKALLKLRGIEVPGEEGRTLRDPEALEEMMALQETLTDAASPSDFKNVQIQVQKRLDSAKISFADAIRTNQDDKLLGLFLRLTYLSKLAGDIKTRQRQSSIKVL